MVRQLAFSDLYARAAREAVKQGRTITATCWRGRGCPASPLANGRWGSGLLYVLHLRHNASCIYVISRSYNGAI